MFLIGLLQVRWLNTFTVFYADDHILYFNEDSGSVIFFCNEMGILDINLNKINLDATFYDEDEPETTILVRLLAWHIKFEKRKALKKELHEELIPIAWNPKKK